MIFRLILLFLIIWFLIWLIRKQLNPPQESSTPSSTDKVEDMVACEQCGTHVPRSLSIQHEGKYYCCEAHLEGKKDGDCE